MHFDRLVDVVPCGAHGSSLSKSIPQMQQTSAAVPAKPLTLFPDRKRRRTLHNRPPCAPHSVQKLISSSGFITASAGLDVSPWRRAAIESLGLSYLVYRKMKHSGDCAGWKHFVAGPPRACEACATLQLRIEKASCGFTPGHADGAPSIGTGVGSNKIRLKD